MDLKVILSVTGHPGLFKMISQMKGGVVVESLLDGRRMPAYASQKILALEDISIYTDGDDMPLKDIFTLLFKKTAGKPSVDPKKASVEELSKELSSVLPNYDRERVYSSDLKKLFQWYNLLAEKGLLKEEEKEEKAPKKEAKEKAPKAEKEAKPAKEKAETKENKTPKKTKKSDSDKK